MSKTKAKEKKLNLDMPLVIMVLAGVALLGGIVAYALFNNNAADQKTGDSIGAKTENSVDSEATDTEAAADKLGANEVKFTSANFKTEVEDYKGVVLVDVYASWCPHCQKLAPVITELADEYVGKVKIGKLNANNQTKDDQEVVDNFNFAVSKGLQGYPTVWIYKDGQKVEEFSGEREKSEIKELLEKYL